MFFELQNKAFKDSAQHFGVNCDFHVERCAFSDGEVESLQELIEDCLEG